nr:hypothetical protein [Angustibacter aerolatus]
MRILTKQRQQVIAALVRRAGEVADEQDLKRPTPPRARSSRPSRRPSPTRQPSRPSPLAG